jgi:membrane dipeptidase
MGIRHAMLTWNEANHLATSIKGNPEYGITSLGKKFIKFMNEHNMIVDVSHLNEKSFYDVLEEKPKILIASHSNAYELSNHPRNLKDEQLVALRDAGGMIGVVAARNFVSREKEKQNIKGFVDQIEYIVEIMGIDNVMFGFDMMNFLDDFDNSNLDDLKSHADVLKVVEELKTREFSEEDIDKICYKNYLRLKERVLEE